MATNTPIRLSDKSQKAVVAFNRSCCSLVNNQWNLREQLRAADLAYMRELDITVANQRAKIANSYGDADRYQNVTVPVILPAVEAAVTYQTSVFLSGDPIFDVVSSPKYIDEAKQLAAVIANQSVRGGWKRHLQMFFRDGFKYNLSAIETSWCREVTAAIETDVAFSGKEGKPKEIIWEGNALKHLSLYNCFFDTRVAPTEMHSKGEFFGYHEMVSRIELKQRIAALPEAIMDNIVTAFESGTVDVGYGSNYNTPGNFYIPPINPKAIIDSNSSVATTNWFDWAGIVAQGSDARKIQYKNMYQLTTLYGKILPSDFGIRVPSPNTPQIWKFLIVNGQTVIYAERQTNAHNWIPVLMGQPLEDGLAYQTKSLLQNVSPMQSVSSALMNSVIAARRRAISDRGLYDPSRVTEAAINSTNPSAKIPVRPSAFGKPLSEAYFPIPFRDDQSGIMMQQIGQLQGMANNIAGQNPARQGQFVKGNKTLHEYSDVMAHANGRDQMTSILLEDQVFMPMKYMLKINIMQYQGGVSIYDRKSETEINVDPVALRKSVVEFKVSDGLTPSDRLINAESFQVALQVLGSSPQIAAGYNIGPAFSYLMKTQNAEISAFEKPSEQVAYEQAVAQWQQVAIEAAKSGTQIPPQPVPQAYGYNPAQTGASTANTGQAPKVNNITNNITNNRTDVSRQ